jgi:hypothetical protein
VVDGAGVGDVLIERGVDYGLGKLADVYQLGQDGPAPLALRWHGIGTDERDVMTEWDAARRRCRSTIEPHAVAAGRLSARTIAEAAQTIPSIARTIAGAVR